MIFAGGCHCGALAVEFETARAPETLPVRECQCGFCQRHAARNTVDADGRMRIVAAAGALRRYRFALATADFCSARAAASTSPASRRRLLDNQHARLAGGDRLSGVPRPMDWSGETADERRARRRASWTPATIEERS